LLTELRKTTAAAKDLEAARQHMRESLGGMEADVASALGTGPDKPKRAAPASLRKGDRVHIHSLNQEGTVIAPPNAVGEVQIQAGIMQVKIRLDDLSLAEDHGEAHDRKGKPGVSGSRINKSRHITTEVDLRGMTPEEATETADKYLDDAFLSSLSTVTIIHGKGTGALRNAIHAQLKRHPHVREYRLGKFGEGEAGVTVVTLK
jgi:DNA mismatch repair protein MutS2